MNFISCWKNYCRDTSIFSAALRHHVAKRKKSAAIPVVLSVLCLHAQAATYQVTTRGTIFDPIEVDCNVGDTIDWYQNDDTEHWVYSDDGLFNSGILESEEHYLKTFNTPGTYPYHCLIHGYGMSGVIVVSATAPNIPPVTPANLLPMNNATNQPLTVQLTASVFSDLDGDTHAASEWILRYSSNNAVALDSGEISNANSLTNYLPAGLTNGTGYDWQVRYKDNRGSWSDYSTPTHFSTVEASQSVSIPPLIAPGGFTNGHWQLVTGVGSPGTRITVLASTNLVQWTDIGSVTSDVSGKFLFMDSNAILFKSRFYCATNQ